MSFSSAAFEGSIATVTLHRGKVNAINEAFVDELKDCFEELGQNNSVRAVILTGRGKFFSFGFDIPEFLSYSRQDFTRYLTKFTDLYTELFLFPKPIVAAINGHAIAGGCMLALTCDHRLMVTDRGKISLNEVTFGSTVPFGSVEMLRCCTGFRNAELILCTGVMYDAEEAHRLGLIDRLTNTENLLMEAKAFADSIASVDLVAYQSLKRFLREPVAEKMRQREPASIREFVDIWYSDNTRNKLKEIKIYE